MAPKAHVNRPARRRVGVGKRTRGFSPLRQRPVWSFLSEGTHSETTRRRGQALAEEGHLHFGTEDCCIVTRQRPFASADSRNSPSIFILHVTLHEGIQPWRSPAAAAAPSSWEPPGAPHTRNSPSILIHRVDTGWEPPHAPHRRALHDRPVPPRGRALYIGM
jgi:hypothetical protein